MSECVCVCKYVYIYASQNIFDYFMFTALNNSVYKGLS